VERGRGVGGLGVAPQLLDEPIARDHAPGVEQQDREQRLLLGAAEPDDLSGPPDLQRAENLEFEPRAQSANLPRAAPCQADVSDLKGQFAHSRRMRTHRSLVAMALPVALVAATPAWATFPGGNGMIAFQHQTKHGLDIHTIQPDGTHARTILANRKVDEADSAWSPDGTRLAFTRSTTKGFPLDIWSADPNGGDLRRLTRWNDLSAAPAWAGLNRIVYFTAKDHVPSGIGFPASELYSMAADGSDQRRLTHDKTVQTEPSVSPLDGRVVYTAARPIRPDVTDLGLYSMAADGSHARPVAKFMARRDVLDPNWSPDGKRIVFEVASPHPRGTGGGSGRQSDIAIMDANGRHVRKLTNTRTLETNPVWSPDGTMIAFTSDRHAKRRKRERPNPDFEIYIMRADGTGIRRLTHNKVADLYPDWQPLPR
jgi:Tol biopolymer transport system component